ncbi:MAG: hypothetical protein IKL82_05730 [Clostridia bacterium]|nr:hypothetical protein [Clostridia bacterium]
MNVQNVINTALLMLNETELYNYINGNEESQERYVQDKELLIKSLNEALYSISEYYPLQETQTLVPVNGKITYKSFSKSPYKIVSIEDENGYKVNAKINPVCIEVNKKVTVTYKYYPSAVSLTDILPYDNTPITENIIAFGLISEFLVYRGRYNEALAYSDKFINGLIKAKGIFKKKKLKAREWF